MYKQKLPIDTNSLCHFLFAPKASVWPVQESFDFCKIKSDTGLNYDWGYAPGPVFQNMTSTVSFVFGGASYGPVICVFTNVINDVKDCGLPHQEPRSVFEA